MQVILLERVENLGGIGDEVKVRAGFARNYLLPNNKALRATEANKKIFEAQRAEIEARNAQNRAAAERTSTKLDGKSYVLIRQAGEGGQLYGSVSARDVAEAIAAAGESAPRSAIVLDKPIKAIGVYPVKVKLHAEVAVTITVNVARSADEAERQARGENVIEMAMAEERAEAEARFKEISAASVANEPGAREE